MRLAIVIYAIYAFGLVPFHIIASHWKSRKNRDKKQSRSRCCGFATDVFEIMESVIKVVYAMEKEDKKEEFTVVGKCETDYDCVLFMIEYTGTEPMIKSSQADPEENEGRYFMLDGADYDEIPDILKRNKFRTFKKAIKDEIPLGGFLDEPYERWYQSIISKL